MSPGSVAREKTAPTAPQVAIAEPVHVHGPATRGQVHKKNEDASFIVMNKEEVGVAVLQKTNFGLTSNEALVQVFDLLQREGLSAFYQGFGDQGFAMSPVLCINRQKLMSHFHEGVTVFGQLITHSKTLFHRGNILCHPGIDIAVATCETFLETTCRSNPFGLVNGDTGLYDSKKGSDFLAPVNCLLAEEKSKVLNPFFGVTAGDFFKKVNESCEILVSNRHDQLHDFTEHAIHGQIVFTVSGVATAFNLLPPTGGYKN